MVVVCHGGHHRDRGKCPRYSGVLTTEQGIVLLASLEPIDTEMFVLQR